MVKPWEKIKIKTDTGEEKDASAPLIISASRSTNKMLEFAENLSLLNQKWNLELSTCCEEIGLERYGIRHNKCIDGELIIRLFRNDKILMDFLGYREPVQENLFETGICTKLPNLKNKGQRKICGCIMSKDIGEYDTCSNLCVYCYANCYIFNILFGFFKTYSCCRYKDIN